MVIGSTTIPDDTNMIKYAHDHPHLVQKQNFWDDFGRFVNVASGNAENNRFNAEQASIEREYNSAQAAAQREHELYMSNTAYQRAAADMQAAGINPATLSGLAGGGAAASGSSSSAASASHASAGSGVNILSGVITSLIGLVGMLGVGAMRAKSASKVMQMQHNSRLNILQMRKFLRGK